MGDNIAANIPSDVTIDLSSANITAKGSSDLTGFDDPRNILNHTDGVDAAGQTWLLANDTAGYWQAIGASIGTFSPVLLRLSNTQQNGRGTKAFAFTPLPENGFANLSYTDPQTGEVGFCDAQCPLASFSNKTYQDFLFVNVINMDGLRLNVSEWYGAGGGLDGLLLAEEPLPRSSSATSSSPINSASLAASTTKADRSTTTSAGAATITITPPPSSSNEKLSSGEVAGTVIGVVVFALLLVASLFFWRRKSRMARQNIDSSSSPKDRDSKMSRPELDGNSPRYEKESGVQAREMDPDTSVPEIDGGGQAHEIEGNHWKREMDGKNQAHVI